MSAYLDNLRPTGLTIKSVSGQPELGNSLKIRFLKVISSIACDPILIGATSDNIANVVAHMRCSGGVVGNSELDKILLSSSGLAVIRSRLISWYVSYSFRREQG